MIKLPDLKKSFEYENNFYLSCDLKRISKILAHYELFKMVNNLPGAIVECGVFKGISLVRFAMFRDLFGNEFSKKIIGFDTYDEFPETKFKDDVPIREKFIKNAGNQSISRKQLEKILKHKNLSNISLVPGDICQTVPEFVKRNPQLKISMLNLDTDIYEPAVTILKYLFPLIVKGGILVLDDYGVFPGETKAVDEYFNNNVEIKKFNFCMTPSYIIK